MNAVVTIAIGEKYQSMAKLTHPTLRAYADRVGAEFIVIDQPSSIPHWEKMQLYQMLVKYHRIIYFDTDLIVRDDCPDLFEMVPEFQLGIFNEGRFTDRSGSLDEACREYRRRFPEKWEGIYYNTGVMVLSRRHRSLFKLPEHIASLGMYEQGYLNMKIILDLDNDKTHEERVCELDYKLNRMQLCDTYCGIHRCDSYIVHYAGAPLQVDVHRLIREDMFNWDARRPEYKYEREIVIYMGGGMGDQLGAEPVARFTMSNMFKDVKTNYTLVTNWPRFFTHLNVPCFERTVYEAQPRYDTPVKVLKTIPAPDESSLWQHWSHISGHTLDYAAISAIHRILPDDCRDIHMDASLDGLVEVMDIMGETRGDRILVHPGRGWASKTFPADWWEEVIQRLLDAGKCVGVIGQQVNDDQGYVDITVPEGAIDFRNLLSLDGLIALIAISSLLISNDSAPIHIAGAFDNQIILIATCKHPDYILPYRKGTKTHKAFAFKKKLTIDDWDLSSTRIFKESADVVKGNILDYIPTPEEIVSKAVEMHGVPVAQGDIVKQLWDKNVAKEGEILILDNDNYEPEVTGFLRKVLTNGHNVIDVGANFGFFTAISAELTKGKVIAFEPEKVTYAKLQHFTKKYPNVITYNNAVGDKNGVVDLFVNIDNDGGHALWNPADHPYNPKTKVITPMKQIVNMVRLDDIIDFAPTVIKTDTEGCELMVLKGAERLLREHKPYIVCELNNFAMSEMGTSQKELGEYMGSLGYKAYTLPDETEIDLNGYVAPYANCNVVFRG